MRRNAELLGLHLETKTKGSRNVFEIDDQSKAFLRERVSENKGIIRIFIHPFFDFHRIPHIEAKDMPTWYDPRRLDTFRKHFLKLF